MSSKFIEFIKNFCRALSANVLRILFTMILTLLLPKLLGTQEYGMWQLYLFYVTYASYNSLGWSEGVYLKYGGQDYDKLNRKVISGQIWSLFVYEIVFNIVLGCIIMNFMDDPAKKYILWLAFISAGLDTVRYFLQSLLQCTNRIKEYARIVMAERVLFFALAIIFIAVGSRNYVVFIVSEILSRFITLFVAVYVCRDVVFAKPVSIKETADEAKYLISCGFKLSFASMASQLIIGIVRFAVEQEWGTEVFGKISLTLSMSNMVITCLTAVSVVLFPVLRRMDEQKLKDIYSVMRMILTVPLFAILLLYVPFKCILTLWLPQYAESLKYLAILFPICIYEVRTTILNNTYFKTYRKENYILYINIVMVALSFVLTCITVGWAKSLDLAVVSIVLLMMIKCLLSELRLRSIVGGNVIKDTIQEVLLTFIFIMTSWYMADIRATLIYAAVYLVYIVVNRKYIIIKLKQMRDIVKK